MEGTWILGNNYRTKSTLYGSYPPAYLERVRALCPETPVLHCFSGSLPPISGEVRIDLIPSRNPDIVGDATCLPLRSDSFNLLLADPPYSAQDATKYGTGMPNRRLVLHELARVARKGATLVWLDTQLPMFAKRDWHWWGAITLIRSSNHRVRLISFFEKV